MRTTVTAVVAVILGFVAGMGGSTLLGTPADEATPGSGDDFRAVEQSPDPEASLPDLDDPAGGSEESIRTEGYRPQEVEVLPYAAQSLLDLNDPNRPADDRGVHIYERGGQRHLHPVATAQYGLAALAGWERTEDEEYLRRAVANADALIDAAIDHDGGIYFPYTFDFPLGGIEEETIRAPWWSAMAQGQSLSLFVRLHEELGEERFREAAEATFQTFDDMYTDAPDRPFTLYRDERGYLWFEEYAGNTDPLLVLNGHIFAIYGLYDYHRLTGSDDAVALFDAGATTVRRYIDDFRVPGDVSYYCLRRPLCHDPLWQNPKYHRTHTSQLKMLSEMTGDKAFAAYSELFQYDVE